MKCQNCDREMELEEYTTDFLDNDEQVRLNEHYWCPLCDRLVTRHVLYQIIKEWVE